MPAAPLLVGCRERRRAKPRWGGGGGRAETPSHVRLVATFPMNYALSSVFYVATTRRSKMLVLNEGLLYPCITLYNLDYWVQCLLPCLSQIKATPVLRKCIFSFKTQHLWPRCLGSLREIFFSLAAGIFCFDAENFFMGRDCEINPPSKDQRDFLLQISCYHSQVDAQAKVLLCLLTSSTIINHLDMGKTCQQRNYSSPYRLLFEYK